VIALMGQNPPSSCYENKETIIYTSTGPDFRVLRLVRCVDNRDLGLRTRSDATRRIASSEGTAFPVEPPEGTWVLSSTLWESAACSGLEMLE